MTASPSPRSDSPDISPDAGAPYELFPAAHRCSYEGPERRFGFELEFAGIELALAGERLAWRLGGSVRQHSDYRWIVETADGCFSLENDISWLQRIAEQRREGEAQSVVDKLAEQVVGPIARELMPLELVAPPLTLARLAVLDEATDELRRAGAVGTWAQPIYAFGVHINPEVWAVDAATLTAVVRAYAILQRFLIELLHVDPARRLLPFIKPYPDRYVERIVADDYAPELAQLIDDYLHDNPTRDRSLDMLPLFAFLDHYRVFAAKPSQAKLIKARPTFHYRLPNSALADPSWRITDELRSWALVEHLAADAALLTEAAAELRRDIERKLIAHPRPAADAPWLRELLRRARYPQRENLDPSGS
jgi:hypothetical protein